MLVARAIAILRRALVVVRDSKLSRNESEGKPSHSKTFGRPQGPALRSARTDNHAGRPQGPPLHTAG